jgi:hypothetical protein
MEMQDNTQAQQKNTENHLCQHTQRDLWGAAPFTTISIISCTHIHPVGTDIIILFLFQLNIKQMSKEIN